MGYHIRLSLNLVHALPNSLNTPGLPPSFPPLPPCPVHWVQPHHSPLCSSCTLFMPLLGLHQVTHCDSMGLHFLEDMAFATRGKGMSLLLANPSTSVGPQLRQLLWVLLWEAAVAAALGAAL